MKQIHYRSNTDNAVSPVVGVMLMLVVVIIIAAVVSAFAGGLATGQKKAPTAMMEFRVVNGGNGDNSYSYFKVLSVSEPIPTKDVKIVVSWKAKDGTTGGTTILPWSPNITPNCYMGPTSRRHSPWAWGTDIIWSFGSKPEQQFGNYTLTAGVVSQLWPQLNINSTSGEVYGYGPVTSYTYKYYSPNFLETDVDMISSFLGKGWEHLRQGDSVNIKFIHIPSGKTFVDQNVPVEESNTGEQPTSFT